MSNLKKANQLFRSKKYYESLQVYEELIALEPKFKDYVQFNINKLKEILKTKEVSTKKINIVGSIDYSSNEEICIWAYDSSNPKSPLKIKVYINNKYIKTEYCDEIREDVFKAGHLTKFCGLRINLKSFGSIYKVIQIKLKLEDDSTLPFIPKEGFTLGGRRKVSYQLEAANKLLTQFSLDSNDNTLRVVFNKFKNDISRALQDEGLKSINYQINQKFFSNKISIVIPVYEGFEETVNCIESVFLSINSENTDIIVINDKSPNPKITKWLLDNFNKKFQLIENKENLGFVKTVNIGMQYNDNDVVLLNSDTIVGVDFASKLQKIAYSKSNIATVTPFSNNATLCSFPKNFQDNQSNEIQNINEINKAFESANLGKFIEIPTAHGFCMYIKRTILNELGYFNEEKFGKGYGEENEFSQRVINNGYVNVHALDTYITHLGSVSFSNNSTEFIEKNSKVLNEMYPDYSDRIVDYIYSDPSFIYRQKAAYLLLLNESLEETKKNILHVTLSIGGGTDDAVNVIH
jgi:GT2 family glycosyltransferase